jgi:biotin transport system substrate-specific component
MQVFTVLMSAIFLGKNWALFSQVIYVIMGIYGLPVFAGFKSGFTALAGPTGGYIAGFIIASFAAGYLYEKADSGKNRIPERLIIFISCIAGLLIIYSTGFLHLAFYLYGLDPATGLQAKALTALNLGVMPFIIFDLLKITLILAIVRIPGFKKT